MARDSVDSDAPQLRKSDHAARIGSVNNEPVHIDRDVQMIDQSVELEI